MRLGRVFALEHGFKVLGDHVCCSSSVRRVGEAAIGVYRSKSRQRMVMVMVFMAGV